ncbi:MAG: TonB-dependent receptor [Draconibacterium sp.]
MKKNCFFNGHDVPIAIPKWLKITKLLALFVLAAYLQVAAEVSPQKEKVNIQLKNSSLRDVFKLIEDQTEYTVFFKMDDVGGNTKSDYNVNDKNVIEALDAVLSNSGLTYTIKDQVIVIIPRKELNPEGSPEVGKQEKKVLTGVITDSTGEPLPGVSVVIKGTANGTITDVNGNYTLPVESENTVVYSFIGFETQEIVVGDRTTLNITMVEKVTGLDEVVVVGYGTQKKVNMTGSVAVVEAEALENRSASSTVAALQGTAAGVTVTRSSGVPGQEGYNIQVRGFSSVNNNPLLVLIDGVEGSLDAIQPEDIESISVLKDAAAASIYGSRAAGGVMLITSKKGQEGKIRVNYNGSFTVNKPARMPERLPMGEIAVMQNLSRTNAGVAPNWTDEDIAKINDPNIWYEIDPNNSNAWKWYGDFDYIDLMINKTVPQQNHNISVSGGKSELNYRLSATYYDKKGLLVYGKDNNKKYSFRANLNSDINKYLRFETDLSYNNDDIQLPSLGSMEGNYSIMYNIINIRGLYPLYTPNGQLTGQAAKLEGGTKEYDNDQYQATGRFYITDVVKGLKVSLIGSLRRNANNYFSYAKKLPIYGVDQSTIIGYDNTSDFVTRSNQSITKKDFQFLVDYDLKFNKHKLHLLGGYSFEEYRSTMWSGTGGTLVNDNLYSFNWTDITTHRLSDEINTLALQGVFGRLNYNYEEKYLFEANLRYDGSSKLAKENRYQLFPSFSAAWRVSNESWFSLPLLNDLKLRASWGQLGNGDVLGSYDYIALLQMNNNLVLNGQQTQYAYQSDLASADKSWETIETSNIAVDLGMLNNKLTLTGEYYVKRNKDMLAYVAYPSVIGIDVPTSNVGELKTWGWEVVASWKQKLKDFSYHVAVNLDDSQNKLVSYYGKNVVVPGVNQLIEGMPINSIYGYLTDGFFLNPEDVESHVFQSNITGVGDIRYRNMNDDDQINSGKQTMDDHGDLVYLGNTSPRFNFGINLGAEYKGFDFSMFFQGVLKRSFYAQMEDIMPFYRSWYNPVTIHRDYWTEDNRDAYFPRLYEGGVHNYQVSDHWMQNGAYIRLKNLQLGYTLPNELTMKAGLQRVRIYFSGEDLWEYTKTFDMYDPEMPANSSYRYPFTRGFSMGANITF